jgi:hypothetical protein
MHFSFPSSVQVRFDVHTFLTEATAVLTTTALKHEGVETGSNGFIMLVFMKF